MNCAKNGDCLLESLDRLIVDIFIGYKVLDASCLIVKPLIVPEFQDGQCKLLFAIKFVHS
jgi:hypothetical protein